MRGGAASDPGHRHGVSLDRRCGVLTSEAFSHLGWSRSSSRHYEDDWPWWAGGSGTPDPYGAGVPPDRNSQMPDRGCVARTCRGDPCVARCAFRRGTPRRRVSAASAIRTAESASPRHRIAGPLSRRVGQRPTPTGGKGPPTAADIALHRAASPTLCRGEEPSRPARCKRGTPTRLRSTTFTFRTARWIRVGGRRVGRAGSGWAHVVGGPHPRAGSSVGIIMLEEPAAGWSRMSRQGDPSERVPPTIAGLVDTRGRCTRLESRDLLVGGPVGTGP
jgi:hypothetical protein